MRRHWGVYLLAAALGLALNLPLRWSGRLGFYGDDFTQMDRVLEEPPSAMGSWSHLAGYLLTDEPLFHVYYDARFHLLGTRPRPHHLMQGILIWANAVLAFSLVLRLSGHYLLSFFFLILFATQPHHGEAYYWPAAVYGPLLLYLLAALHLAVSWLREGGMAKLAGCGLCYTLAVFTHEASFGFIGVFGALWALERAGRLEGRDGLRFLGPLAAVNAAYLAVRQTRWFGAGDPGFLFDRKLELGRVWSNFVSSLSINFGFPGIRRAAALVQESAGTASLVIPLVLLLGLLLAVAWPREGAEAGGASFRRLGAFAAAWFLFAYAPTYVFYLAGRHHYLPSAGVCLLLALALASPTRVLAGERRALARGALLGLAACAGAWFHVASVAEGRRWIAAAEYMDNLKSQLLRARPTLPAGARVVILDAACAWKGVPAMPGYAVGPALRLWYGDRDIRADSGLVPGRDGFGFTGPGHQPYDRLLLLSFRHQALTRREWLVLEDGARIRAGSAIEAGREPVDPAPVSVVTGRRSPDGPCHVD